MISYALRESARRRVFRVVLLLTVAFLALHTAATTVAFDVVEEQFAGDELVEERTFAGATLLGLAMFATLFLGATLGAFLTLSAIRGDAERGLLQPILARPVARTALLAGRFLAAAVVGVAVAGALCLGSAALIELAGGDAPSRWPAAAGSVCLGVTVVAALALTGSTLLSTTGNGIAVFLLLGAGLAAGLLGQLGDALESSRLNDAADVVAWALPFEALHQHALAELGRARGGLRIVLQLGPFGGADAGGWGLFAFTAVYVAAALTLAAVRFRNMEL